MGPITFQFIESGIGDWCALTVGNAWFKVPIFEHGVHSPCTLMSHGHNQVDELFILLIFKNLYQRMMQTSSTQEEKVWNDYWLEIFFLKLVTKLLFS